jgi:hypothetical protein
MSRVLKNEIQTLRENLMTCFRETLPSEQFNATLSLSIIWLHVLVDREAKTEDQEERRCIADEFDEGKRSIERGIETLYEQTKSRTPQDPLLPQE